MPPHSIPPREEVLPLPRPCLTEHRGDKQKRDRPIGTAVSHKAHILLRSHPPYIAATLPRLSVHTCGYLSYRANVNGSIEHDVQAKEAPGAFTMSE